MLRISTFTLSLIMTTVLFGQRISEVKLYYRCYAHFLNSRPSADDPRLIQVKNSQLSAVDACEQLLNLAKLSDGGELLTSGENREKGKSILETFQHLHTSWFEGRDFVEEKNMANDVFDYNIMGLYFTKSLFNPSTDVKKIFTDDEYIDVRRDDLGDEYLIDTNYGKAKRDEDSLTFRNLFSVNPEWNANLYDKGEISGFKKGRSNIIYSHNPSDPFGKVGEPNELHVNLLGKTGVAGRPEYILLNSPNIGAADGALVTYRRWSNNFLSGFLCRDLPLISTADAIAQVEPEAPEPFKNSVSCMKCHSTMDPMAAFLRNIKVGHASFTAPHGNYGFNYLSAWKVTRPSEDPLFKSDRLFYSRPPKGRLYMRDMNNNLINKDFDKLEEFTQWFSQFDDMYSCVASKYFKYFTGIEAKLNNLDPVSGNGLRLESVELEQRNFAINLGKELKTHQDIRKTIKSIINSPYYRDLMYKGR